MSEELTYRYKRLNELDEIFELTHSYGDDYPEIINRTLDRIVNNEIELNKLKDRINKAIEYIEKNSLYDEEYDYNYEEEMYLSGIDDEVAKKDLLFLLKGDKE